MYVSKFPDVTGVIEVCAEAAGFQPHALADTSLWNRKHPGRGAHELRLLPLIAHFGHVIQPLCASILLYEEDTGPGEL